MTLEEDQALADPDYWDNQYSKAEGDKPTHEWYRTFESLEPFFSENLFNTAGLTASDNPFILHIGSGDSVCGFYLPLWPALIQIH